MKGTENRCNLGDVGPKEEGLPGKKHRGTESGDGPLADAAF